MHHRHRILSNDSLVVHRVTKEDEGAYTCVGVASETVQYTAVLELSCTLGFGMRCCWGCIIVGFFGVVVFVGVMLLILFLGLCC